MPHSFVKIWLHAIWATKDRYPLIAAGVEKKIHQHMYDQFVEYKCGVRIINGMPDHVHCLFLLNPEKTTAEVIKQVKGSTSHFINQRNLTANKFAWQVGYAAYSVSESQLERVYQYIKNQKEHHLKKTFDAEYNTFIKLHGFQNEQQGNG